MTLHTGRSVAKILVERIPAAKPYLLQIIDLVSGLQAKRAGVDLPAWQGLALVLETPDHRRRWSPGPGPLDEARKAGLLMVEDGWLVLSPEGELAARKAQPGYREEPAAFRPAAPAGLSLSEARARQGSLYSALHNRNDWDLDSIILAQEVERTLRASGDREDRRQADYMAQGLAALKQRREHADRAAEILAGFYAGKRDEFSKAYHEQALQIFDKGGNFHVSKDSGDLNGEPMVYVTGPDTAVIGIVKTWPTKAAMARDLGRKTAPPDAVEIEGRMGSGWALNSPSLGLLTQQAWVARQRRHAMAQGSLDMDLGAGDTAVITLADRPAYARTMPLFADFLAAWLRQREEPQTWDDVQAKAAVEEPAAFRPAAGLEPPPARFEAGDKVQLPNGEIREVWDRRWAAGWDDHPGVWVYHLMDPETHHKIWTNDTDGYLTPYAGPPAPMTLDEVITQAPAGWDQNRYLNLIALADARGERGVKLGTRQAAWDAAALAEQAGLLTVEGGVVHATDKGRQLLRELPEPIPPASDEWYDNERAREAILRRVSRGQLSADYEHELLPIMELEGSIRREGDQWVRSIPTPTRATPEEIDAQLAVRAYDGTSHFSNRRGPSAQRRYASAFNNFADKALAMAKTPGEREIVEPLVAEAKRRYRSAFNTWLHSRQSVTSWMVTGPAGRNESRERKKSDSADRRAAEADEVLPKALERIRRELGGYRLQQKAHAQEERRRQLIAEYSALGDAATRGPGWTKHTDKRRQALRREIEALGGFEDRDLSVAQALKVGEAISAEDRLERIEASQGRVSATKAREVAEKAAMLRAKAEGALSRGDQEWEFPPGERHPTRYGSAYKPTHEIPGGRMEIDWEMDRIRIWFDERLPSETYRAFKGGWNYSRRDGDFRRKITVAALNDAEAATGVDLSSIRDPLLLAEKRASDEAARKVEEARAARKAAARSGTGNYRDVLDAAMRKGSRFKVKLPKTAASPRAGKWISPSVRKAAGLYGQGSATAFGLTYNHGIKPTGTVYPGAPTGTSFILVLPKQGERAVRLERGVYLGERDSQTVGAMELSSPAGDVEEMLAEVGPWVQAILSAVPPFG